MKPSQSFSVGLAVVTLLLVCAAAASLAAPVVDPELAVTPPLALLQRLCTNQSARVPTLNRTDCVKCMAKVAKSTATESLLGCHSICQSRNHFKHFSASDYAPAKACSQCMSAPGVPQSHCEMCLTKFSRSSTAAQACMTCIQGNRHLEGNRTLQSRTDGCMLCAALKSSKDVTNCNGCISMGITDPALCAAHASVRNPKLTLNFTGSHSINASAVLHAVNVLLNGTGTLLTSTNSSTTVILQYQFTSQLLLDAFAVTTKVHIQGLLDPFFPAIAAACPNCTIHISGLFQGEGRAPSGIAFGCGPVNASAGWEVVTVPRLCSHAGNSSAAGSGRRLHQGSVFQGSVDTTWQYPSFVTTAAQGSTCSGPFSGCGAANGIEQDLITQICIYGGWYVNSLKVTWESGYSQQWGEPDSLTPGCLNIAVDEGEVITGVYTQIGDWMNGLAFVTNFGQVVWVGCGDTSNSGGNGCPGNSDYTQWKYQAVSASLTSIAQAQVNMNDGWSTDNALSGALSQTTSSGYLCGIMTCAGEYINQITLYFMLPVESMAASSTINLVVGAPSSTATQAISYSTASNICSQPGDNVGTISVATNTQMSSTLSVSTSYSTQYSQTDTEGWGLDIGYNVQPVGPSISASYSGSVATTTSSQTTATSETDTTTSSGQTSTVSENQICPDGIPPNAYCNWTFYGYSTVAWTPTAWSIPATYNLLGGASWQTTLGGSTTTGTESVSNVALNSLICNGVQYVTSAAPAGR